LLGRDAELGLIGERVREALDGACPAAFCIGEPGVGKSRLVAEAASAAFAAGVVVIRGRASSTGPVAVLRPFAEALSTIARRGLLPQDSLGGYRPLLGRVLPMLAEADTSGGSIGTAAPMVAFAEAMLRVLASVGASTGCLLLLEDLHEADAESLAVLDYLLDNLDGLPVAVLGTLRDEPCLARELLRQAERRHVVELVPVRRLDQAGCGALVVACLGGAEVAEPVRELVWRNSIGNPLLVEELLYDMVDSGQLVRTEDGWNLVLEPVVRPPASLVRSVSRRLELLGPAARRTLVTAAVYGDRFPVSVTMRATGDDEADFLDTVQAATQAQLLAVDEQPGCYSFRHPLLTSALLELVTEPERLEAATRLAEAVLADELSGPADPPGPSIAARRTAARLYVDAGQAVRAGELYASSGRAALAGGAVDSAAADLTEAVRLLTPVNRVTTELAADLVMALVESGQLARAVQQVERLPSVADPADTERLAAIHVHLAWGSYLSGLLQQGHTQLAAARALVAGLPDSPVRVEADVIAACLALDSPTGSTDDQARRLARAAAEAAERSGAAEAACRAWHALGRLSRAIDLAESTACFDRIVALAAEHRLPGWGLFGMSGAAGNRWLLDGDGLHLQIVRDHARRLGSVSILQPVEAHLGLHRVLVAEEPIAEIESSLELGITQARRFGNANLERYGLATLAVAAGQRADQAKLAAALERFRLVRGDDSIHLELATGLGSVFALLLDGRDDEGHRMLTDLADRGGGIAPYYLSGPNGLLPLLRTLDGRLTEPELDRLLGSVAGSMRWNRQFLHLAGAVLAGGRGDRTTAERHATQAEQAAMAYPVARFLGARLVAARAAEQGWGDPVGQLRAAEAWFHEQQMPAAARACRDLLRSLGASVRQRRDGSGAVPPTLRRVGVTVREYEVGLLAREHLGNKAIGDRLHISPRTVEKHIAALLVKLGVGSRGALIEQIGRLG